MLKQSFHEQCEIRGNSGSPVAVPPPRQRDCDGIIGPGEPDARYNKHRGVGNLVQVMETFAEDDSPED